MSVTPESVARQLHELAGRCRCLVYGNAEQEAECLLYQATLAAMRTVEELDAPQQEGERVRMHQYEYEQAWGAVWDWAVCRADRCPLKHVVAVILPEGSAAKEGK